MLLVVFYSHDLGQVHPLEGKVTVNPYKVALSDHFCSMMKHFYTIVLPSIGH